MTTTDWRVGLLDGRTYVLENITAVRVGDQQAVKFYKGGQLVRAYSLYNVLYWEPIQ